jgi:hypothetical protein
MTEQGRERRRRRWWDVRPLLKRARLLQPRRALFGFSLPRLGDDAEVFVEGEEASVIRSFPRHKMASFLSPRHICDRTHFGAIRDP